MVFVNRIDETVFKLPDQQVMNRTGSTNDMHKILESPDRNHAKIELMLLRQGAVATLTIWRGR
jgi:hypothetical protein